MRGTGSTFSPSTPSRFGAARALLAGAAILAGSCGSAAFGQEPGSRGRDAQSDTAFAIPRVTERDGSAGVALPQPLAPSEAVRIRQIFRLQAQGDFATARAEADQLRGTLLLGHIVADRLLRPNGALNTGELGLWLARYPDQPSAPDIHALLVSRLPVGANQPPAPFVPALEPAAPAAETPEEEDPAERVLPRSPFLDRAVRDRLRAGDADGALRLVVRTRSLDPRYAAQLRAEIARALFCNGDDAAALALGEATWRQSGGRSGLAAYVAGLAAWRLGRADQARPLFEGATRAEFAPSSLRAGAAFWAARAHLRTGDPAGWTPWMQRASRQPRTFYGLLARRTLGLARFASPGEERETLGEADVEAIAATPGGLRAFALLQVGETRRAEAELRRLWPVAQGTVGAVLGQEPRRNPALARALLLVASAANLTDLAAQLASLVQTTDGRSRDYARFPIPTLRPRSGFLIDQALVYALARLESNFDPGAVSGAGARGLMQLMPTTAGYISGGRGRLGAGDLHDPALNLELGQRYLLFLMQSEAVGGNMIRLLASYNSGPGSFARWSSGIRDLGDPLLFIESIPNSETRGFVSRVLTYTWIYAARLRLPSPSLDELAAGAWPRVSPRT